MSLQVEIVADEGRVWHGPASYVQVPAHDGQIGILPGRQPLLAVLGDGKLTVTTEPQPCVFQVHQGFVSVDDDFVTIVAQHCEPADPHDGSS